MILETICMLWFAQYGRRGELCTPCSHLIYYVIDRVGAAVEVAYTLIPACFVIGRGSRVILETT